MKKWVFLILLLPVAIFSETPCDLIGAYIVTCQTGYAKTTQELDSILSSPFRDSTCLQWKIHEFRSDGVQGIKSVICSVCVHWEYFIPDDTVTTAIESGDIDNQLIRKNLEDSITRFEVDQVLYVKKCRMDTVGWVACLCENDFEWQFSDRNQFHQNSNCRTRGFVNSPVPDRLFHGGKNKPNIEWKIVVKDTCWYEPIGPNYDPLESNELRAKRRK